MRYNQLGNTGLFVSEICLGTMTFGEAKQGSMWGAIADVDQNAADRIVERSLASGVNFIDTADVYSSGESERLLGQALKNLDIPRKDVVIATKVYGVMGDKPNDRGASRGHIMDSVEASLKRLQTDHIDLYQIHATDAVTPIEETLGAFDDLVSRGSCAISASPTGRPGAFPRRSASPNAAALPVSKRCRPIIRSPAAISSATSCR
ncbi:aryl-alcohol dehydrogenase-like predicted oxidoreductase [Rhizobium leguminosarum]|nr:aryl-alcohol dehydrogenase-like predicted oxidoreductase [Rhizobium leguminosarum]